MLRVAATALQGNQPLKPPRASKAQPCDPPTLAAAMQELLSDPLAISWINVRRPFHEATHTFGYEPAGQNQGCGAPVKPAEPPQPMAGGGQTREPSFVLASRLHSRLSHMARVISNYKYRGVR